MMHEPQANQVNRVANQAIYLQENENITMLEAIETACSQAFIPETDDALTIGTVQAYLHQLQDAVTQAVYAQKYHIETETGTDYRTHKP